MKKGLLLALSIFFSFVLVACQTTTSISTSPSTSTSTTTMTSTTSQTTTTTTTTQTTTTSTTQSTTTTLDPTSLEANIPADCSLAVIENGWIPVWCDEFNYVGPIDQTKWRHQVSGGGFGNQELQYYTARPENAWVDGEKLIITAIKENYMGHAYTSSKIWTQGLHNFKYGKFEVRAKVPSGGGTWPAFWMMPKSSVYGGWPNSGEIDILEHTGNNLNSLLGTIHTGKYNHMVGTQIGFTRTIPNLSEDFHVFGMTWNEYSISWFIDGLNYGTTTFSPGQNLDVETYMAWPFDQEFYLILNLAMGGGLGGTVDPNFVSDTFEIDYVRVYQRDYAINDTTKPTMPTDIEAVRVTNNSAFLIWNRSFDNKQVRFYNIYLEGNLIKQVPLNIYKLSNLAPDTLYSFTIEAEDYAGNKSIPVPIEFRTLPNQ